MVSGLSSRAWEVLFFLTVRRSPAALVFSPVSVVNLRGMAVTSVSSSGRSDSRDPPGSSVHGILRARILEWIAIPFYRGLSQSRDRSWGVSHIAGRSFTI